MISFERKRDDVILGFDFQHHTLSLIFVTSIVLTLF